MAIYYARIFDSGMALEAEVRKREETMAALRGAIADADRAGMAKSEFLARMSHELRTPLNAVIGYSELLRDDALEQQDKTMLEDAERIHDAGKYLLRLINMILDLAKLESGKIRFNVQTHAIARVIDETIDRHKDVISANRNSLLVELDPALTDVSVDGDRLGQVLSAMLENAAMHTADGAITIRARAAGQSFELSVSDTGPGIDPAVLPTLFEAFAGTRDAAGGRFGGTGLSMTLVSRLCTAMGGKIGVVTEPGKGAAFTVALPMQAAAPKPAAATQLKPALPVAIAA
jgi:signal transduction histidine kinase